MYEAERAVRPEVARLQERVAELERALAESRQREQRLRESERRLQMMVDGSDDGGWDWQVRTGEAYMSPSWFRMLGLAPGELPSTAETWSSLIHPDDSAQVWEKLQSFLEGRIPTYEVEHRMRHKSGGWRWIMSRAKVFARDESGRATRMTGTLRDITARKEMEEELRRSQSLLNVLVEHSPAAIDVRDLDGRFILVNARFAALVGVERERLLGRADHELFAPARLAELRAGDEAVRARGEPVAAEQRFSRGGEPATYLCAKFPLRDEQGRIVAIGRISTDITERRRAEEERAVLQESLIDAQRRALRELSTPLIPIAADVVLVPLVGTIDSQRALQLLDTLLDGVSAHRASTVIIDVTGVQVIDTAVANALIQASRAVGLLGAQAVITGIRPEVARTLVTMGADLGTIVIHGSLRSGVAYALGRDAARARPRAALR